MTKFVIKRIYEPAQKSDGYRVLVDRLWPRGLKKDEASIHAWTKDIAPSPDLRKWFNHDPEKWLQFKKSYKKELDQRETTASFKEQMDEHPKVTLLYAAKDEQHNHAVVLKDYLESSKR